MSISIRQRAACGLATVFIGTTGIGIAQEPNVIMTMPAPSCAAGDLCPDRQISVAAVGAPPPGLPQVGIISTSGMSFATQENVQVVKNQPYQARAMTEIKQTLADGSHIAQTTTATVARDNDGRTVRIQQLSALGPWRSSSDSSKGSGLTLTTIFDPVAKTHIDYTSDNKVAHVAPVPPPVPGPGSPGGEAGFVAFSGGPAGGSTGTGIGPMTFAVQGHANSARTAPDSSALDTKTDSLCSRTIEGISAMCIKTTTTIPAGTIGNDKDLVITRESWYSTDLKLVIQSIQSDPRFGETTYSLTNIQRNEPDPALFRVPDGYTIDRPHLVLHQP